VLGQAESPMEPQAGTEQIDLFRFFAHAFAVPSVERFEWLQRPEMSGLLQQLWDDLECPGHYPGAGLFTDYDEYESTYVSVFEVGLPAPPVPLQETAHDDSTPAPQTVLENVDFYQVLGLNVDPARYAPDHLVTQLEFLSAVRFIRDNASDPENLESLIHLERDFIERHLLSWLPIAEEKLAREDPPIFPVLLTLLLAFLRREHEATGEESNQPA
jgi:DMSO reductase family type II enzyme chaperone